MDERTIAVRCAREIALCHVWWRHAISDYLGYKTVKFELLHLVNGITDLPESEQLSRVKDILLFTNNTCPTDSWRDLLVCLADTLMVWYGGISRQTLDDLNVSERCYRTWAALRDAHVLLGRDAPPWRDDILSHEVLLS